MMRAFFVFGVLVFSLGLNGQILTPVKWSTSYKQVAPGEFDLIWTAKMDKGWTIYSQHTSDEGPVPTSFHFDEGDHFTRMGEVSESGGKRKEGMDPIFEVNVIKFVEGPVIFTQRVKVKDFSQPITGYLEFMTCDDSKCLPPSEESFSFSLTPSSGARENIPAPEKTEKNIPEGGGGASQADNLNTPLTVQVKPAPSTGTIDLNLPAEGEAPVGRGGIVEPVHWGLMINKTGDQEYELIFSAGLDPGWSIYSQENSPDEGPVPTTISFEAGDHYLPDGGVLESGGKRKEGMDPFFNLNVVKYVEGPVYFTQKVRVNDPSVLLRGFVTYMACDAKECLTPTDVAFRVDFAREGAFIGAGAEDEIAVGPIQLEGGGPYPPDFNPGKEPVGECGIAETVTAGKSSWRIFLLGFLGGLVALLTPCVFPMIPLTVSFFTKGSENKRKGISNAILYGLFIFLVYLVLSLPFHLMDSLNPDILNDISTNVWLNVAFFLIFLFFAFSFFGYYEITLPSSWANKASAAEGIGGMIGTFFMALTLALVSFSCTGPILGSLLAGALTADGGAMQLTMGMGGFGLALALPFALFAAFPSWLSSLPKSGGWLNTVKVVLGFVELALALKFLSNADLVEHWGLLKIEPFLGLWILTGLGLALYLFGKIRFPHDSPPEKPGLPRLFFGVITTAFVLYLASGFLYDKQAGAYRPLKLLSGLAPPACYSWFYPCDCPQNLDCFKDLESGLAYARENNKPIMIDFTGYACVNCRKMEEHVWPENQVYRYLKDDYVLISLYVDDKQELPEDQQQVVLSKVTGSSRKLRTLGNKWSHFQTEFFNTNTQPYYVLISPQGDLLTHPVGYTPDPAEYSDFLRCGLENYRRLSENKTDGDNRLGKR